VAGSSDHGNEPFDSIQAGDILDQLSLTAAGSQLYQCDI
jgi:hypothetical protein